MGMAPIDVPSKMLVPYLSSERYKLYCLFCRDRERYFRPYRLLPYAHSECSGFRYEPMFLIVHLVLLKNIYPSLSAERRLNVYVRWLPRPDVNFCLLSLS